MVVVAEHAPHERVARNDRLRLAAVACRQLLPYRPSSTGTINSGRCIGPASASYDDERKPDDDRNRAPLLHRLGAERSELVRVLGWVGVRRFGGSYLLALL